MLGKFNYLCDRIFVLALIAIPFSFPFAGYGLFNFAMIVFIVMWVFSGRFLMLFKILRLKKIVLLFVSTYLIYVVCLIYSENLKSGLFILEKKIPLLIFPLILATISLTTDQATKVFFSFIFSCFLATMVSYFYVFNLSTSINTSSNDWYRDILIDFMDLHPTYFGMYICFSIVFLLVYLSNDWNRLPLWKKYVLLFILLYFVAYLLFLSSRIPIVVLVVLIIGIGFKSWIKFKKIAAMLIVISIAAGFFFSTRVQSLTGRFREIFVTQWAPPVGIYYNSTNLRIGIYFCSIPILIDNWFLGLGTGDVQGCLNKCYKDKGFSDVMHKDQLNSHNEYINVWLNTGLIGIILFLLSLLVPFRLTFLKANLFYMAFIILMMISFLTENVLERQKGIVFYSFFNSLLALNPNMFRLLKKP